MPDELVERRTFLRQFLQEHAGQFQDIIRAYVLRAGVAYGEAVSTVAQEIFQDAVLEALAHAERLDPTTRPGAWFLSIALNLIKRKRASQARNALREVLTCDLATNTPEPVEGAYFEQLTRAFVPGPEQEIEAREQAEEILALVSESDALVLRLAIVQGLNTELLARELDVHPGAARVRLHRAVQRLRAAWQRREANEEQGKYHA